MSQESSDERNLAGRRNSLAATPAEGHVWKICVDTGGTFTDCLARDPAGEWHQAKVLSSSTLRATVEETVARSRVRITAAWRGPDDFVRAFRFRILAEHGGSEADSPAVLRYDAATGWIDLDGSLDGDPAPGTPCELHSPEPAPLLAIRLVTATPAGIPLPALKLRLATTWGTNALLTGSGTPPVLFINRGFADLLAIGTQARPDLFALHVERPKPLYCGVVEIAGRLDARGQEIEPLAPEEIAAAAADWASRGHPVAAVALLHADKNPAHEQQVAARLRAAGFAHVTCSSEVAPFIRILPRAETAVVDAYLAPTIGEYHRRIEREIGAGRVLVMTSAGGLVAADEYRAKDSLLSGPAGGIAGAAQAGRRCACSRLIAFDMGGTSTDVARYDGDFEYVFEHAIGDVRLVAPALAIESVAAGGGSICRFDGRRLRVGPESAGARPGPACYGAAGPLTLTDVNLLLGRLDPQRFTIPVVTAAAAGALAELQGSLAAAGQAATDESLLEGLLAIANQRMAGAIRRISIQRGYDPREYTLVAFGGAGPQHALAVAEQLGVARVIVPPAAALLSAEGLAGAPIERFAERQVLAPLAEVEAQLPAWIARLDREALDAVGRERDPRQWPRKQAEASRPEHHVRRRITSLRFAGQDATLDIDLPVEAGGGDPAWPHYQPALRRLPALRPWRNDRPSLADLFVKRYAEVFGHRPQGRAIELVTLRVIAATRPKPPAAAEIPRQREKATAAEMRRAHLGGAWRSVPVYAREALRGGDELDGPALITERFSATVVEPGWHVVVDSGGSLIARCAQGDGRSPRRETQLPATVPPQGGQPEAVREELFLHRFTTIAREMGDQLQRTAVSTNIKERRDYSCALLDPGGELVVNAPHIPVHLGSLGLCVREVVRHCPPEPGDTLLTNHPAFGGSHLPDVTLITPVHDRAGRLLGYVASRAHHAELGGLLPGSMPPQARRLVEEGVVLSPMRLVRQGEARWDAIGEALQQAPYPSRAIADNLADLRAALAANHRGANALAELGDAVGSDVVTAMMRAIQGRAERMIRAALHRLPDGARRAEERLDDGALLKVAITIEGDQVRIDFTGSAPVHAGNLNATPAVVRSAVMYVLRLLIDEPLPLNEGLMRPVELIIPAGLLNPPFPDDPSQAPAVVGGNVETSQRLVNALLRALGLAADSQGTMNNLTFGDDRASYYETIGGGTGAGPGFAGASGVHSHMTNTRITDPEVIEHRHPVRVERFAIRRGSGGAGRFAGGDGIVRAIRFLAPMSVAILSQHRTEGPAGLAGGEAGRPGRQWIERAAGDRRELGAIEGCEVAAGDRLVIETPGGGGYGVPPRAGARTARQL